MFQGKVGSGHLSSQSFCVLRSWFEYPLILTLFGTWFLASDLNSLGPNLSSREGGDTSFSAPLVV